jgi:hypothetical protein
MNKNLINVVGAVAILSSYTARAVTFTTPAAGAVLTPGATITARVSPSPGEQITAAAFLIQGSNPVTAVASTAVSGAFEAQLTVPSLSVGPALIFTDAQLSDGTERMDFVEVKIEPGSIKRLTLTAPGTLTSVGQISQLQLDGLFSDGITRRVTSPATGTTYQSSNDSVLGIYPTGLIQARTTGFAIVTAMNRGQSVTQVVQVAVPNPAVNHIPIANPGTDQAVAPVTLVTLSGVGSSDPDGGSLTFEWNQESGPLVILRTPRSAQTVFTSPRVDRAQVLTFSLVVSNNNGATTFPALVKVTVDPALAAAGPVH